MATTESSSLLQRRKRFVGQKLRIDCKVTKTWDAADAHCTDSTVASARSVSAFTSEGSTAFTSESAESVEEQYHATSSSTELGGHSIEGLDASIRSYDKWIEAYQPFEQLGQGSAGVVYRAVRKADKQNVAVKIMRMNGDDEDHRRAAGKEFEILRRLHHPCIIKAWELVRFPMGAALVMEYFPGITLKSAVREAVSRRLQEPDAQRIFSMLIRAVAYLHRNDIIHRDVKTENVLVSAHFDDLRLIDFNVAKSVNDGALTMTGTVDYMPPEVLLGESPTAAGDIWAAGLCLYLMLCGKLPLDRKSYRSRCEFGAELSAGTMAQLPSPVSDNTSGACKAVLWSCLQPDPRARFAAEALLFQQWIL